MSDQDEFWEAKEILSLPRSSRHKILTREALRYLPLITRWNAQALSLSALRATITLAASQLIEEEIKNQAYHDLSMEIDRLVLNRDNRPSNMSVASWLAHSSALSLLDALEAVDTADAEKIKFAIDPYSFGSPRPEDYENSRSDPKSDLFSFNLWLSAAELRFGSYEFTADSLTQDYFKATTGFWRYWFQGFIEGNPLALELQRRVASIGNDIWKAGVESVAKEIARIEAEFLAEKAPQAERLEFNSETGKFFAVQIDIAKPDLLGATLSQVQDALDDVLASPSNGLHERSRETRVLRRAFERYGNDPQQIEMGFVSVHKGLTRQIVVAEELPASEENLALMDALEEGARAIRATHPEVDENRKIINQQAIKELPHGAKETLEEALPMLVAISEEDLADDWRTDIPQLINDATEPLPNGAPPLPGVDETMRICSRAAKISIWMKTAVVVHKIDGSAGYKAARIVTTLAAIVTIFIAVLT